MGRVGIKRKMRMAPIKGNEVWEVPRVGWIEIKGAIFI